MATENRDLELYFISKKEFEINFNKRLPEAALTENIDYTFAALLEGTDPEAITITAKLTFLKREQGRLAVRMSFLDQSSFSGYLTPDGMWLPDENEPLGFIISDNAVTSAIEGCFTSDDPDNFNRELRALLQLESQIPVLPN